MRSILNWLDKKIPTKKIVGIDEVRREKLNKYELRYSPRYGFLGGGGGGVGLGFSLSFITSAGLSFFCAKQSGISAKPNETTNSKLINFFAISLSLYLKPRGDVTSFISPKSLSIFCGDLPFFQTTLSICAK